MTMSIIRHQINMVYITSYIKSLNNLFALLNSRFTMRSTSHGVQDVMGLLVIIMSPIFHKTYKGTSL